MVDKIMIPDAYNGMRFGLSFMIGKDHQWLPEYDDIVSWLTDSQGRGLLLMGPCGVGKSIICTDVIPVILYHTYGICVPVYNARDLNTHWQEIISTRIVCIDDVGCEDIATDYGERHVRFADLVDLAERESKILLLTTNLSISSIEQRYGQRTASRLRAITRGICINHPDMRR